MNESKPFPIVEIMLLFTLNLKAWGFVEHSWLMAFWPLWAWLALIVVLKAVEWFLIRKVKKRQAILENVEKKLAEAEVRVQAKWKKYFDRKKEIERKEQAFQEKTTEIHKAADDGQNHEGNHDEKKGHEQNWHV